MNKMFIPLLIMVFAASALWPRARHDDESPNRAVNGQRDDVVY
jgi:hypothetical protein